MNDQWLSLLRHQLRFCQSTSITIPTNDLDRLLHHIACQQDRISSLEAQLSPTEIHTYDHTRDHS